jgi:hypothetical protein
MAASRFGLILLVGLAAGAAMGFAVGRGLRLADPPSVAISTAPTALEPTTDGPSAGTPDELRATIAILDVDAEIRRIGTLPSGPAREAAITRLLDQWVKQDPIAALQWLRTLSLGDQRRHLIAALVAWTSRDPKSALDYARGLPAGQLKRDAVDRVLQTWARSDATAAINYARALPRGRDRNDLIRLVVDALTAAQPDLAASLLAEVSTGGNRMAALESIATNLSRTNGFGAGFQWSLSLPNRDDRIAALASVVNDEVVRGDAAAALRAVLQISDLDLRGELVAGALNHLALEDPNAAVGLMTQLPASDQTPAAWRSIIAGWATNDPLAAAEYARTQLTGDNYEQAIRAALSAWIKIDPQAAAQYSMQLADSPARNAIWRQTTWALANSDPSVAASFVNSLPDSMGRDQAMGVMARDLARTNPTSALQWASEINNDNVRNFATRGVYLQWYSVDAAQATQALQASNLPADQKAAILNAAANGGRSFGGRPPGP